MVSGRQVDAIPTFRTRREPVPGGSDETSLFHTVLKEGMAPPWLDHIGRATPLVYVGQHGRFVTNSYALIIHSNFYSCVASSNQLIIHSASMAPTNCAMTNNGTSIVRIPEKVLVRPRAMVTAGLAKEVEAVNQ